MAEINEKGCTMPMDTKQIIADQLFQLLTCDSPENITVKRLVEACGISRQTFYYHFRDVFDVMEWGCAQVMERALANSLQAPSLREAITAFIVECVDHRQAIGHLISSQYSQEIFRIIHKAIHAYLWHMFGSMFPGSTLSVADTEILLDFFTGGITGLLLGNYARRDLDTEALADQIYRLLSGQMRSALGDPLSAS